MSIENSTSATQNASMQNSGGSQSSISVGSLQNSSFTSTDYGAVAGALGVADNSIATTANLAQSVITGNTANLNSFLNSIKDANQSALQVVSDKTSQAMNAVAGKTIEATSSMDNLVKYVGYAVAMLAAYSIITKVLKKGK